MHSEQRNHLHQAFPDFSGLRITVCVEFLLPLAIKWNIRGTLSWLRWKFSQHVHSMTLKMETIMKILRRKSLVRLFTNINYVSYAQPVWLVSFRVEDTSILRMEVDQISLGSRVREIPFWLSQTRRIKKKLVNINGAVKNAEEARKTPCEMMRDLCAFALRGNYENQSRRRGSNPDLSDTRRNAISFRVTILIPLVLIEMLSLLLIFPLDLIRRIILDTSLQFIIDSCRAQFDWGFVYVRCVCCEVFTLLASQRSPD
jgi:hypothetical protein